MSDKKGDGRQKIAVKQFLAELAKSTHALESQHLDTGRLLTVFTVRLETTKKIEDLDLIVGVQKTGDGVPGGPLVSAKPMDPNVTYPLRMKDVMAAIETLYGRPFKGGTFQAIACKHGLKNI